MRVPVEADTLSEGDWIETDRRNGAGAVGLQIATVYRRLANEDIGTPEMVELTFEGDPPDRLMTLEPTQMIVRFTGTPDDEPAE